MFKKEEEGTICSPNPDGSQTCKRVVRTKEGDLVGSGSEVTIGVDSSCRPVFEGDLTMMDKDMEKMQEFAKKVSSGCRRKVSRGYTQG